MNRHDIPAPTLLMCELAQHTDKLFVGGEISPLPIERIDAMIEHPQALLIHRRRPVFSWAMANRAGAMGTQVYQAAFRLLLSASRETCDRDAGDLWDTGVVRGRQSLIRYAGSALQPDTVYYWKVRVWDDKGGESPYSAVKSFLTGPELVEYKPSRYPLVQGREAPRFSRKVDGRTAFFDFGRAAAARVKLTAATQDPSARLIIHMGEALGRNGRVDRNPGATIRYRRTELGLIPGQYDYTVTVEAHDRSDRAWIAPMPTDIGDVTSFRYCEVEQLSADPGGVTVLSVSRQVVHYPFDDQAASFDSSDAVLNDVWELCKYSVKATSYTGLYIDGDRERTPYEADSYVNQLCHYAVDREYTMARASLDFVMFEACWPTEWLLLTVHLAWQDYYYTGDSSIVEHYYDELKHKALTALIDAYGLISTRTGKVTDALYQAVHLDKDRFPFSFRDNVDYPFPGILGIPDSAPGEIDGFVYTDYNAVINAYFYRTLQMMAELARVVGRSDDAASFDTKAARVRQSFQEQFFRPDAGVYRDGIGTDHSSLHASMFALCFGLVPTQHVASVMEFIRSRGMACSVYGAQFLLDAVYLADDGAYGLELMTATHDRSWAHMLYDLGSTVTLEAWDVQYKPNLDWNHIWGAAPGNIIPRRLMGLEPIEPGFLKMRIKPRPGPLQWAKGRFPTIKGDVAISFENPPGGSFLLAVEIPPNVETELWLPVSGDTDPQITRDGAPARTERRGHYAVVNNACTGAYRVDFPAAVPDHAGG